MGSRFVFHDRAFDRGLVALEDDLRIRVSSKTRVRSASRLHQVGFYDIAGQKAATPSRFAPDIAALAYHREKVFLQ